MATARRSNHLGTVVDEDGASLAFTRASVAMVMTNPRIDDNPIVYVNDAFGRLTGYDKSAVIGRNCRFLQGPDTDPEGVRRIREAIAAREEISIDLLNYRADGEAFLNRLVIAPVYDDAGQLTYFLGIQKEMTSRDVRSAEAGAAADASEPDIAEQLTAIQHRVRNHLSMIVGMIRVQARGSVAPEEFSALAHRIESLQLLYEEMMRPAPEARNEDVIALGAYITRLAAAISHTDGRPGIRVNVESVDTTVGIDAATRIGLIASELLTNAMRHAFRGRHFGSVEMRLSTLAQGGIRLSVSDDGVGIAPDVSFPDQAHLGGRIVARLLDGLGGSLGVVRGAAGTVVTLDVPPGGLDRVSADGHAPRRSAAVGDAADED